MCLFCVNLKEILSNFDNAKKCLNKKVKVCAVVKANAYGFGAEKICTLLKHKADYFAVSRLSEFLKLKNAGVKKPILILSPLLKEELPCAVENGAEITLSSIENLEELAKALKKKKKTAKVHIALDTGMSRFGIKTKQELERFLEKAIKLKNIEIVGVFSHLYSPTNQFITRKQRNKFIAFKNQILSFGFKPIFHLSASEGLKNKDNQFDMVRLGFDLYDSKKNLHCFKTKIVEIKTLKKGESVSYNGTFVAPYEMKIAVCEAGYADGLRRALSNKGEVIINGLKVPIVGNICMDCFMADISECINAQIGDEVIIFGTDRKNSISVCEIAENCDTIPYEIYAGISNRVKRIYKWR